MGVRDTTVALLKSGLPPSTICRRMGVSLKTTLGYLEQMIGRGTIRRSDVFYTLSKEARSALEGVCGPGRSVRQRAIWQRLTRAKLHEIWDDEAAALDDITTFIEFRDSRFAMQDLYEDICVAECKLHQFIRAVLVREIGEKRSLWWRLGIPVDVRKECASRCEEDEDGEDLDPYCFTDTIHLAKILKAGWKLFEPYAHCVRADSRFKKDLVSRIARMNLIRRKVMHPVRGHRPTEEDFEIVRSLREVAEKLIGTLDK